MSSLVFTPTAGSGWTNSNNIIVEDAVYASAGASGGYTTATLLSTLNLSSLPDTATINGLKVEVKGYSAGAGDATPKFEFNDGSSLLKTYGSIMSASNAWYVFGSETDLWGQASITPARLKNASAQWKFNASNSSFTYSETVYVDSIRVTIYYTNSGISSAMLGFCF